MAGKGWFCLCLVALMAWLAFGLPSRPSGMDGAAAMSLDSAMVPGCDGHADLGKDGPCPPAWCVLCPVLLPSALVIPDGGGAIVPTPADERGGGLSLRPHPPPPRPLRRA